MPGVIVDVVRLEAECPRSWAVRSWLVFIGGKALCAGGGGGLSYGGGEEDVVLQLSRCGSVVKDESSWCSKEKDRSGKGILGYNVDKADHV